MAHHYPFGLNDAEALPILEAALGRRLEHFRTEVAPAAGGSADRGAQLLTIYNSLTGGKPAIATVLVKECRWKHVPESVHYRYLDAHDVPTPRLLGTVQRPGSDEIIFLERLDRTGFNEGSVAEWRSMLSLLARFNACPIPPDYEPHLHPYELIGQVAPGCWISGIPSSVTDHETGQSLRAAGVPESAIPRLQQATRELYTAVAAQPTGLLHQDFMADNLGWHGEEMVVFDLHKNARGPRFADVAPYLAEPDWTGRASFLSAPIQASGSPPAQTRRESLTRHYLAEYSRYGGPVVTPETFQDEMRSLFWSHKVACLSWYAEKEMKGPIADVLACLTGIAG